MSDVRERASASSVDHASTRRTDRSDRPDRAGGSDPDPFDRLTDPPEGRRPARGDGRRNHTPSMGGGTISQRVARILALPAVVVLVLLALLAADQVQSYRESTRTSRSVKLALSVQNLVGELQTERGITAAVLGGNPSFKAELGPSRQLVDQQRRNVEDLLAADGGVSSSARSTVRSALRGLDGLEQVRSQTDDDKAGRAATFTFFTQRIAALSSIDVGLENTSDPELRRGVTTLQALGDLAEATAQERAFLNGVFSAGGFASGEFTQFATMRADRLAALARFERVATPEERTAMNFVFGTGAAQVVTDFEQTALAAADGRHIVVNPQSWWSGLTTVLDDLTQLQRHVGSEIQVRAADLQRTAAWRIGGLIGVVLACFVLSIYLARLASRSITRPLAALAAEAESVAGERLPQAVRILQTDDGGKPEPPPAVQVPANATAEIKSVASALDHLQTSAYGLATDQAVQRRDTIESMANLGRRNQNLIRRQLGFITSLEREEVDPAALANLFELDHLATRMRRNAASLLVLVDASTPRQWSSAVSVADMIRAAVSEVEEYRRVTLRRLDEAYVTGSAVGSIAHLLAELIENGLTFSPPDMDVEVQGRRLVDGYLIAITDQGVGMSAEDLARANARLKGEGDFIAAPTRFLGHFVVGKLARETGVKVELLPSPATGITARISLPAALIGAGSSVEVRAVTDRPADPRPRHADSGAAIAATNGATHGSAVGASAAPAGPPHLLALPQRENDVAAPQTPTPWQSPAFRRPAAHDSGSVPTRGPAATTRPRGGTPGPSESPDPDRTPSSGIPIVRPTAPSTGTGSHRVVPAAAPPAAGPPAVGPAAVPAPQAGNGFPPATNGTPAPPTGPATGPGGDPAPGSGPIARPDWQPPRRRPWPAAGAPGLARPQWPDSGGMAVPPREIDLRDGARPAARPPAGAPAGPADGPLKNDTGPQEIQRTQNGLRKRTPRTGRPTGSTPAGPARRTDEPTRQSALVGGTPTDVGARMTALRAGLQRGQSTGPTRQPAEDSGKDDPAEGS